MEVNSIMKQGKHDVITSIFVLQPTANALQSIDDFLFPLSLLDPWLTFTKLRYILV